jgi:hypothetical protein
MRRATLAAAVAVVALMLSVDAAARTPTFPTTIIQRANWSDQADQMFFAGYVDSPKRACIPGRTVKVVIDYTDGSSQVLDTDLSSGHGAWSAGGTFDSNVTIAGGTAKVLRKRIGRRHHHRICKADSTPLNFAG